MKNAHETFPVADAMYSILFDEPKHKNCTCEGKMRISHHHDVIRALKHNWDN